MNVTRVAFPPAFGPRLCPIDRHHHVRGNGNPRPLAVISSFMRLMSIASFVQVFTSLRSRRVVKSGVERLTAPVFSYGYVLDVSDMADANGHDVLGKAHEIAMHRAKK